MKDVLRQVRRRITPQVDQIYNLVGVRLYCGGARIQGNFDGKTLQAPTLNRIELGDIIYNKMWASKGTFAVVGDDVGACYGTTEYPVFRALDGNSEDFIFRVLAQPRFWKRAEAWSSGSTDRTRLNPDDFLMLPIPTPPPAEQRAIVALLEAVESAIALTRTVINAIEKAKHGAMRQLLTRGVKRDRAPLKPLSARWVLGRVAVGISHIPSDWSLVTLTTVAKLESGHTPSREKPSYWDGEVAWISLADTEVLDKLVVYQTSECVTSEGIANSSARILPKDTVIFSRTATVGKATRLGRPMATSQDFANWVCGKDLVPGYLVQVFRHMQREWSRLQEGSTHQTIYMPVFKKLQILLPPVAEQHKIAELGEAFDRKMELEKVALGELIASRDALAQELLSGRLRIPEEMIARHRKRGAAAA